MHEARTYAALAALLLATAATPARAAEQVVARFAGTGAAVTGRFKTEGPFDVRWRTEKADGFRVLLDGFPGGIPSIVADPATDGGPDTARSGVSSYFRAGDYSLAVRASGPWRIEVVADR